MKVPSIWGEHNIIHPFSIMTALRAQDPFMGEPEIEPESALYKVSALHAGLLLSIAQLEKNTSRCAQLFPVRMC